MIKYLKPYAEHAITAGLIILAIIGAVLLAISFGERD